MTVWVDVIARARGLSAHLLPRERLRALAAAADLGALAEGLRAAGLVVDEPVNAAALELAVRRAAAGALAVLARWSGPRAALLRVVFDDEDRRSVRAILRGAAHGVPAAQRLAGLVPTPSLPERALLELARQPTTQAVVTLLEAWRHPFGAALRVAARSPQPDLLAIETALGRAVIAGALEASGRAGSDVLRDHARRLVDAENLMSALALAGPDRSIVPRNAFVASGCLTVGEYERAAAAPDRSAAAELLARAWPDVAVRRILREQADDAAALDRALLDADIARLVARSRRDPLDTAPILLYALRLRAEVLDLRRVIWGVVLGAPPELRRPARSVA